MDEELRIALVSLFPKRSRESIDALYKKLNEKFGVETKEHLPYLNLDELKTGLTIIEAKVIHERYMCKASGNFLSFFKYLSYVFKFVCNWTLIINLVGPNCV